MCSLIKHARSLALLFAIIPVLSCTTTSAATSDRQPAAIGGFNGGGGNELIAQFVSVAQELIASVPFTASDKQILNNALASAKITTVAVLLDPVTGVPVPNQDKLVAWGSPGSIQLKTKSSAQNVDSFEDAVSSGRIISYIVIHELYRASGITNSDGQSPDETFQISIGKYHLDKDSTGAALSPESQIFLYAECSVAHCGTVGMGSGPNDSICGPDGYYPSKGTLQIYKYAGHDPNQQHDGYFGITDLSLSSSDRMGNEELFAVKLVDGAQAIQVVSKGIRSYRNFYVNYQVNGQLSSGHAEIEFERPWRNWVTLDFANCHTN